MNHHQITAFVKAQKLKSMTQSEIKKLASEIIGDGQTPNLWFVTHGPYVLVQGTQDGDCWDFDLIEGFDKDKDTFTQGPFTSYEDALDCYNEIELDVHYGVGQAFIEDRECGMINEKWLTKRMRVVYEQEERDDSKYFYEKIK